MSWLTEIINSFLTDLVNDVLTSITTFIEFFFTHIDWASEIGGVNAATNVIMGVSVTLLVFMAMKQLVSVYILETGGDADMDPMQMLVKVFLAIALITTQPFISDSLLKAADLLYNAIINQFLVQETDTTKLLAVINPSFFNLLLYVIYAVFLIIIIVKAMIRAIELIFYKMLFSLFCVDLVTVGSERFTAFMTSYLVTIFGYIIQVMCVRMSMVVFLEQNGTMSYLEAIVLVSFAIKAPNWLEKFTYSTGVGKKAAGGVRGAASMGLQIARMVK